jgi:hypothetical protein
MIELLLDSPPSVFHPFPPLWALTPPLSSPAHNPLAAHRAIALRLLAASVDKFPQHGPVYTRRAL